MLRGLVAGGIDVPLVLSQPDRPAGRRRVPTPPPVAVAARELGLPLVQPEHALDARAAIADVDPQAVAICAYGQLIPTELLDLCPWLNLHPSLLPRWRGAAPIERALMAGDTEAGVAIMDTVLALDAGPIVSMDRFAVAADADTADLEREALRLGVPALIVALTAAAAGALRSDEQAEVGATYASKLERDDRLIDPAAHTVEATVNRVRALRPQIGALLALDEETFTLWRASACDAAVPCGAVAVVGEHLRVGLADGAIEVLELQTAGKRALTTAEWLRGRRSSPTRATRPA